jgi:hypothetical protein
MSFYDEIHDAAEKEFFIMNPKALKIFGSYEAMKMSKRFAKQCVSELNNADRDLEVKC